MTGYQIVRKDDDRTWKSSSDVFTNEEHAKIILQAKCLEYPTLAKKFAIVTLNLPDEVAA